jgi:pyruvate dehydrogenase E2 component (dihydrolipoamide acetyltransferase)
MATKVHMEALSPTMEEGQVVRWLKGEGDEVAEGDILAEIETDKATMELVARGSGVLRKRLLDEGDTAEVGAVIAVIAAEDEDIAGVVGEEEPGKPAEGEKAEGGKAEGEKAEGEKAEGEKAEETEEAEGEKAEETEKAEGEEAEGEKAGETEEAEEIEEAEETEEARAAPHAEKGEQAEEAGAREERVGAQRAGGEAGDGRVKASPLARRLADEAGLSLRQVEGTGPGGRITKADIEAALERGAPAGAPAQERAPTAPSPGPRFVQPVHEGPEVEEVPVSQMRKTIAKRLVTSIGPVPTFYLTVDIDMTRLTEAREGMNVRLEGQGLKVSINDLLIKATALALKRHPEVNAAWHDDHIKRHHRVHIGVAVAIDEGLITPVVRDADLKGAAQIGAEVREMAGRAREKKLKPEEYTGATFSISNLGMFGIEEFTAIINPPEAAILAVGQVEDRVIVEDGEAVIAPRMKMTMSCDHRVVDGAMGAVFLQTLRSFLEEPAMMMA